MLHPVLLFQFDLSLLVKRRGRGSTAVGWKFRIFVQISAIYETNFIFSIKKVSYSKEYTLELRNFFSNAVQIVSYF